MMSEMDKRLELQDRLERDLERIQEDYDDMPLEQLRRIVQRDEREHAARPSAATKCKLNQSRFALAKRAR